MPPEQSNGPSAQAIEAAARVHADWEGLDWRESVREQAEAMLKAAYPVLRADVLAEVVDGLRTYSDEHAGVAMQFDALVDWLQRELG